MHQRLFTQQTNYHPSIQKGMDQRTYNRVQALPFNRQNPNRLVGDQRICQNYPKILCQFGPTEPKSFKDRSPKGPDSRSDAWEPKPRMGSEK